MDNAHPLSQTQLRKPVTAFLVVARNSDDPLGRQRGRGGKGRDVGGGGEVLAFARVAQRRSDETIHDFLKGKSTNYIIM
jgi:hypothetical protein